ncbi:unnamed protein product [Brassicogethes aeneus]|uniref:RNA-directed DNA polymerase n=1 Tax=Brassicogethes aeneus TaxID=1431903 RepID=A0A9P0BEI1_BRAAE|nr:unnamed protein product [Brassicogethes aeneus]
MSPDLNPIERATSTWYALVYFATAHGKGCVDETAKTIVRTHIKARDVIVNSASNFVRAIKMGPSEIKVEENFQKTNFLLNTIELFSNAKTIRDISNAHQIQRTADDKIYSWPFSKCLVHRRGPPSIDQAFLKDIEDRRKPFVQTQRQDHRRSFYSMTDNELDDLSNLILNSLRVNDTNETMTTRTVDSVSLNMLKMFVDTIPRFDGDVNNLNNFISAGQFLFDTYGDTEDANLKKYLIRAIQTKLIDRAQILVGSRSELNTWKDIKNAFQTCFDDNRNIECLEQDLFMARPFKNESLLDFGKRLQVLRSNLAQKISLQNIDAASKKIYIENYDKLTLRTYIRGLSPQIQCIIRLKNPTSLEEALTYITEEENFQYTQNLFKAPPTHNVRPIFSQNPQHKQNNYAQNNHAQNNHAQNNQLYSQPKYHYNNPNNYKFNLNYHQANHFPRNFPALQAPNCSRFPSQPISIQPRQNNFKPSGPRNFRAEELFNIEENSPQITEIPDDTFDFYSQDNTNEIYTEQESYYQNNYDISENYECEKEVRFKADIPAMPELCSNNNITFILFDFHNFFDGIIGLKELINLKFTIDLINKQLINHRTRIPIFYRNPKLERYKISLNALEVASVKIPVSTPNDDIIIPEQNINDFLLPINDEIVTLKDLDDLNEIFNPNDEKSKIIIHSNIQVKPPDSETVHSAVEDPILNIPITENCLNHYSNQIVINQNIFNKYHVIKNNIFETKSRITVKLSQNYESEIIQLFKDYIDPKENSPQITEIPDDTFDFYSQDNTNEIYTEQESYYQNNYDISENYECEKEVRFKADIPAMPELCSNNNITFILFDFHNFFDGIIGLKELINLKFTIDLINKQLINHRTRIPIFYRNPKLERYKISLNALEVASVKIPVSTPNDDIIIPEQNINDFLLPINDEIVTLEDLDDLNEIFNPNDEKSKIIIHSNIQVKPPDSETVHSAVEDPILNIPITENCLNHYSNQIVINQNIFNKYHVIKNNIFETKSRITVKLSQNYESEIIQLFKDYIDPNILDKNQQKEIISHHHEITCHRGINEAVLSLKKIYYWPNLKKDVTEFINNCDICSQAKYDRHPPKLKFSLTATPSQPLESIHMDTFQIASVKFLTIIDVFSRYAQAYPLEPICNSQTVYEKFLTFISHFGIPQCITCDNGTELKNSLLTDFCKLHKIQIHFTTTGNSNSNSPVERVHSTFIEIFRTLRIKDTKASTKQLMQYAVLGYNTSVHSVIKQKPVDVINGRLNSLDPFDITDEIILNQFMIDRRERLKAILEQIHNLSLETKTKNIEKINKKRNDFNTGDKVFITDKSALRSKTKPRNIKAIVSQDIGNKIITNKDKVFHKSMVKNPKAFCSPSQEHEILDPATPSSTKNNDNDVTITLIKNPLLPFQLEKAKVISSRHTFIHYLEFKPINDQLNNLKSFFRDVEYSLSLDHKFPKSYFGIYSSLVNHAKYLLLEASNKLNNISPHKISKRGLANIIGKSSKWLFGTLDSDDGQKYDRAISELQNNQNSMSKEISLQMSLSTKLIQNYNNTITLLNENQILIKKRLEYFQMHVNKTIDDIVAYLRAQNTLDQIILNCQNLITFLDNLDNALSFAKFNTLHSSVIPINDMNILINNLIKIYGYRLFPVPIQNNVILPKLPYLILGTNEQQYIEEPCPEIENVQICQNHLEPIVGDCIATLINEAEAINCQKLPVKVINPILEEITKEYVIMIPGTKSIKIQRQCVNHEHALIEEPSLVKIPYNCSIQVNKSIYWNKEEIIAVKPLKLPEIRINNQSSIEIPENSMVLHSINMDKIRNLQQELQWSKSTLKYEIHPATWSISTTLALLITTAIIIFLYIKWYVKKTTPEVSESNHENMKLPFMFPLKVGGVMNAS